MSPEIVSHAMNSHCTRTNSSAVPCDLSATIDFICNKDGNLSSAACAIRVNM